MMISLIYLLAFAMIFAPSLTICFPCHDMVTPRRM
jgi:hypothetical protein